MLLALPSCCGTLPASKPAPCRVPVDPPTPELDPQPCGESVCLSVADTVKLAAYFVAVANVESALAGCSGGQIVRVPQ